MIAQRTSGSGRRRLASALLAAALAGLALAETRLPRRVVVISLDGVGGLELQRRLAAGELSPDGFARALREGRSAERLEVVTPSQTAVMHATLATGAPPGKTGIVGNWMILAGRPITEVTSGFDLELEADSLWTAAARQGKRVASLAWPNAALPRAKEMAPVWLLFNEFDERGLIHAPQASQLTDLVVALPLGLESYSPPRAFRPGKGERELYVFVDGRDDGRRAYDEMLVLGATGELLARAKPGDWFEVREVRATDGGDRDVLFTRWGKLRELSPDLGRISLYVAPVRRSFAAPEDFRRTLDRVAGAWPGPPDDAFLLLPDPDETAFLEQARRFTRFFVRAFEVADRRGDWDLLLGYQPLIDEVFHSLLLEDTRHPAYSPARAQRDAAGRREAYREIDRVAAAYLRFAERGDVIFVSDHGLRAVSRAFAIREALRRQGWLKVLSDKRTAPDSPTNVTMTGGTAYVYVNRVSRPGGVVPDGEADALASRVAAYLRGLKDPDGGSLLATVLTREEMATLRLEHPNSGDVVAIAGKGTTLSNQLVAGNAPLIVSPSNPGQHGFDPDPELDGIFFHVGQGVARERVPVFRALDVAGLVASRLGIGPPGASR